MYKIYYQPLAKKDIEDIVYYIGNILNNKTAASKYANTFITEINKLAIFPYGNPEYQPIRPLKNKYHKVRINNYLVFYIINEQTKTITISRILYKKRNMAIILD